MRCMTICSIRDSKADAWLTPMHFQSSAHALRAFGDIVNDATSDFAKHPEDYTIYKIGEFNDETGQIKSQVPDPIALAANLVTESITQPVKVMK